MMAITRKSTAQVDKEIHIRRTGGKVTLPKAAGPKPGKKASARSAAQVDKDAHIRALGGRVMPRGRLSDASTGRLAGKGKHNMQPRDRKGQWT